MYILRFSTLAILILASIHTLAGPRELGKEYRVLRSNFEMLYAVKRKCPDIEFPQVTNRKVVEESMIEKIGMQQYIHFMKEISNSSLKKDAIETIEKLFQGLDEACNDEELPKVLDRIAEAQDESFKKFEKEQSLIQAKSVPVPLRRN